MPDAAPRGDFLYLYSVYDYVIYDKMINIYLSSLSSCNVGVSTHTQCSTITLTVATCGTAANGRVMTLLLRLQIVE